LLEALRRADLVGDEPWPDGRLPRGAGRYRQKVAADQRPVVTELVERAFAVVALLGRHGEASKVFDRADILGADAVGREKAPVGRHLFGRATKDPARAFSSGSTAMHRLRVASSGVS